MLPILPLVPPLILLPLVLPPMLPRIPLVLPLMLLPLLWDLPKLPEREPTVERVLLSRIPLPERIDEPLPSWFPE